MLDDVRDLVGVEAEVDRHEHAAERADTPKKLTEQPGASSGDTIATRSPCPMPSSSSAAAWARASSATRR